MAEFFSPLWEYLFDTFGIYGVMFALCLIPTAIILLIVLIVAIVSLIKKAIRPSRRQKNSQSNANAAVKSTKSVPSEAPKSIVSEKETNDYRSPTIEDYLKRAKNGEAFAQCCCGSIYENGDGCEKDIEKAIYWFTKAGDQGHVLSNYRLGMIYLEGRGNTKVDLELAEKRLTYASMGEDDTAQYELAMLYSKKNEILCKEKGYTTAEQRTSDAQYNENKEKYKYWLKKAAANGNFDAEYILY